MLVFRVWLAFAVACLLLPNSTNGQDFPSPEEERFEAADSDGVVATRDFMSVFLQIDADVEGPIEIPRLAAPLNTINWGGEFDSNFQIQPLQDTWRISWDDRPLGEATIMIILDAPPLLVSEIEPVTETHDGSFFLPAHLATTQGERIRYEPQPNKNTVGYWAGEHDSATWTINLEQAGRFNVAILQGCGRNQGGSNASITFHREGEDEADATLGFEVLETGHFQNFQWRHLGAVELSETGTLTLTIAPEEIANFALMDVRAVHLNRLPD